MGKNNNNQPKRRKRMSFKERKEQDLLSALDDVYSEEESGKPNKSKSAESNDEIGKKSHGQKAKEKPQEKPSSEPGKTVVYIDGENTFFQIFDALRRKKIIRYREDLVKFDLRGLLEKVLGEKKVEVRYYGAKLKEEDSTPELLQRTQKMIDHKRRWVGFLSSQHIEFVNAGELRIRPVINPHTKEHELNFEEKGVDVKMAVDMVDDAARGKVSKAVIMSSDTDALAAIHSAREHGTPVVYISHESRTNDSIIGSVDETRTFTGEDIKQAFKRVN